MELESPKLLKEWCKEGSFLVITLRDTVTGLQGNITGRESRAERIGMPPTPQEPTLSNCWKMLS